MPTPDQAILLPSTFDFAVLEIDVTPVQVAQLPPALQIAPRSLPVDTKVFMIGSPEGLSFKYIDGGKIGRAVDETELPFPKLEDQ